MTPEQMCGAAVPVVLLVITVMDFVYKTIINTQEKWHPAPPKMRC